jgi:hypothetical protein
MKLVSVNLPSIVVALRIAESSATRKAKALLLLWILGVSGATGKMVILEGPLQALMSLLHIGTTARMHGMFSRSSSLHMKVTRTISHTMMGGSEDECEPFGQQFSGMCVVHHV